MSGEEQAVGEPTRPPSHAKLAPLHWGLRLAVLVIGGVLLVIGIAGLVLPGIQGVLTIVLGLAVLSLASGFRGVATGSGDGVAHFAHLGGFLGGYLYLKWMAWRSPARQFQKKAKAPLERSRPAGSSDVKKWAEIRSEDLHPVNREEHDRILEKIETSGVSSLSPSERAFLDRFSPG